jgi:xanthine dehydrogenase accessory factor
LNVYEVAEDYLKSGLGGTIATIVNRVGAAPQPTGAKVFIGGDGKIFGTIGGGCLEAEVWQEAKRIVNTKGTKLLHYAMNGSQVEDEGMICGGRVDILLEPVLERYRDIYKDIRSCTKEGTQAVVITTFDNDSFRKTLFYRSGKTLGDPLSGNVAGTIENLFNAGKPVFKEGVLIEPVTAPPHVYIFGAGHISRYISRAAKMAEFEVTVVDDRANFANKERFPEADEIIVEDFESLFEHLRLEPDGYAVIVTRGHNHDALVLEEVLRMPCKYVGMIGSKRKTQIIFDHLKSTGVDDSALKQVHAPIGIDIDAETPQEISISIVAELIKTRRAKRRTQKDE